MGYLVAKQMSNELSDKAVEEICQEQFVKKYKYSYTVNQAVTQILKTQKKYNNESSRWCWAIQ